MNNDALVFRIFNGSFHEDRIFVRDPDQPPGNNCWVQVRTHQDFINNYPNPTIISRSNP